MLIVIGIPIEYAATIQTSSCRPTITAYLVRSRTLLPRMEVVDRFGLNGTNVILCIRRVGWSECNDHHAAERRPIRCRASSGQVSQFLVGRCRHSDSAVRHVVGGRCGDGAAGGDEVRRPNPAAERPPVRPVSRGLAVEARAAGVRRVSVRLYLRRSRTGRGDVVHRHRAHAAVRRARCRAAPPRQGHDGRLRASPGRPPTSRRHALACRRPLRKLLAAISRHQPLPGIRPFQYGDVIGRRRRQPELDPVASIAVAAARTLAQRAESIHLLRHEQSVQA